MELKYCKNGHQYDPSITPECPECNAMSGKAGTIGLDADIHYGESYGKTVPLNPSFAANVGKTDRVNPPVGEGGWASFEDYELSTPAKHVDGYNPTMPIGYEKAKGSMIQPVVGWLACVKGPEKGKDYRIHEQNNYIGRGRENDISIPGDPTISRERHAILAYDTRSKAFYFAPSGGQSIVYHNNAPVFNNVVLKAYDQIEIGESKFVFVPLCGENFQWD